MMSRPLTNRYDTACLCSAQQMINTVPTISKSADKDIVTTRDLQH